MESILVGRNSLEENFDNKDKKTNACYINQDLKINSYDNNNESKGAYPASNTSAGEQSSNNTSPGQEHRKMHKTNHSNNNNNGSSSTETSLEGSPVISHSISSKSNNNNIVNNNWQQRKTFRPKQISSVEKIFGQQLEPLANTVYDSNDSTSSSAVVPNELDIPLKTNGLKLLSSDNKTPIMNNDCHKFNDNDVDDDDYDDVIYPMKTSYMSSDSNWASKLKPDFDSNNFSYEPQHVLHHRRQFQHRPTQYATLARTSRFNHDDSYPPMLSSNFLNIESSALQSQSQGLRTIYSKPQDPYGLLLANNRDTKSNNLSAINGNLTQAPSSSFYRQALDDQSSNMYKLNQLNGAARGHINNNRRRQGRYNTLTGSNSLAEWRQKYDSTRFTNTNKDDFLYPNFGEFQRLETSAQQQHNSGPMLLIPRIDSSTLRRQNNKRTSLDQSQQQQFDTTQQHLQDGGILEESTTSLDKKNDDS